jgi:hypothetical protein
MGSFLRKIIDIKTQAANLLVGAKTTQNRNQNAILQVSKTKIFQISVLGKGFLKVIGSMTIWKSNGASSHLEAFQRF